MAGWGKRSFSDSDDDDSESNSHSHTFKRRATSYRAGQGEDLAALAETLERQVTDPKQLLETFTPDAQSKLLNKLFEDPAVQPAVVAAIHALLEESIPSRVRAIEKEMARATKHLDTGENFKLARMYSVDDHPEAVAPFLHDVAQLARLPCAGATKAAFNLLLSVAEESIPSMENEWKEPGGREPFDRAADAMLSKLATRRREEEGDTFEYAGTLKELKKTAAEMKEDFESESWFPKTIALMESWST